MRRQVSARAVALTPSLTAEAGSGSDHERYSGSMPVDMSLLPNGGPSKFVTTTQHWAVRLFRLSPRLRYKMANIGDVADYVSWVTANFGAFEPSATREDLWELMRSRLGSGRVRGAEFGVAWGYGSGWWLDHVDDPAFRWDGFDRFTGLPRAWRKLDAGHFDADGTPPPIDDSRVTWHVGDVEDHIDDLEINRTQTDQLVILFDLDIFEPSLVAWEYLRPHLRSGDILYFDEAYDSDERRLLDEHVLVAGDFELIGATPMALALVVKQLKE